MKRLILPIAFFLILLNASAADSLHIGRAAVKITPPAGAPMAGYYSERFADGVHDDLYSKAIVLEANGVKAALVGLDLINTQRHFVEEARRLIEERTGIPGGNVMISATHAHTGPVLRSASSRNAALGGDTDPAIDYIDLLPTWIAESVDAANKQLNPATVSAAIAHEPTLTFNRRFHMNDGTVGWNPGKLNPKILRPAGPIDAEVPFYYFESRQGDPLAVYVNYSLHLDTVGGPQISADYPHTLAKILSMVKGTELLTLFTIGTAGDLNHIDVTRAARQKGHGEAARIGAVLAGAVIKEFPNLKTLSPSPLQVHSRTVALPLPAITNEDVEQARLTIQRRGGDSKPSFLETVHAFKVLDVYGRQGADHQVEVQVITLGADIAWVSLPGEIFVELGLAIKQASPFKFTAIAELANGSIGYIPTRQAYTQGNYEVVSARCAAGSGEALVEAAADLLRKAHLEAVRQN